jgi:hypothetical protein
MRKPVRLAYNWPAADSIMGAAKPTAMIGTAKPTIVGVFHGKNVLHDELTWLSTRMIVRGPERTGLSVPEDYVSRRERGITTHFFNDVAAICERAGSEIVPLGSSQIMEELQAVHRAIRILEAGASTHRLRESIKAACDRNFYSGPEETIILNYNVSTAMKAIELIEAGHDMKSLCNLWASLIGQQQEHLKRVVMAKRPSLIVTGDSNAKALYREVAGFDYIQSPFANDCRL